jgi:general secretion pathway protein L
VNRCWLIIARNGELTWQLTDSVGSCQQGNWQQFANAMTDVNALDITAILLPDLYSIHQLSFIEAERKLLSKTVAFSLEDSLAEDIDELHFALGAPAEGVIDVAVINSQLLQDVLDSAAHVGIDLDNLYTCPTAPGEQALIALNESEVLLVNGMQSVVVAYHSLKTALAAIAEKDIPTYRLCQQSTIPAGFELSENRTYLDQLTQLTKMGIDLRQGSFRKGIAWGNYWQLWKMPALAALVLIGLMIAQSWWQLRLLEDRNLAYRQTIEQVYLKAFPGSRVVNPRQQMQTKLNALQGSGGGNGSNMVSLLAALQNSPIGAELEISGISYEARAAELRLDVLANNFQQVERLRSDLMNKGIKADLQNSSAAGGKVRAKLALSEV